MKRSPSHRWLWMDLALILVTAGSIAAFLLLNRPPPPPPPEPKPNTVFIVLDTVRSDHLSLCGYERPTSPNLDAFVASGASYTCDAQAPATWTLPSHASFFTGVHPSEHGAHSITSGVTDWEGISARSRKLDEELPMLGEHFIENGYQTRLLSANPVVSAKLGLRRGYEKGRTSSRWGNLFGKHYVRALKKLMGTFEGEKPRFLFLNIADAHRPWKAVPDGLDWLPETAHTEHSGKSSAASLWRRYIEGRMEAAEVEPYLERVVNNYDYAVWRADRVLGQVLEHLETSGFCDEGCRIVITSDHGEMLGEHQLLDHGHYVWQNNVAVPLIYKDIGPTQEIPDAVDALQAFYLVRDGKLNEDLGPPISEGWPHVRRCARTGGTAFCDTSVSLRDGSEKLIWTGNGRKTEEWLVDLATDPEENNPTPLPLDHPSRAALLEQAAAVQADAFDDGEDPATMEMLEALGYAD
jgi:hypothetical protein